MPWILVFGAIATLILVAVVTHLLLTAFNRRGWVYYRNPDAPKGSSLGLIEEIYQPSVTHVIDQQSLEDSLLKDQSESGDPDSPGTDALDR
jgi:hypothetical protein